MKEQQRVEVQDKRGESAAEEPFICGGPRNIRACQSRCFITG